MQPIARLRTPISALLLSRLQCNLEPTSLRLSYSARHFGALSSYRRLPKMDPRPASIAELREAASTIFSMQDLKSLIWVGVHCHFAYSEQDEPPSGGHNDDVDIVTVWDPNTYGAWRSHYVDRHTHLEQRLHQAWKREIYPLDITEGKLSDNRHTDAMLCSPTIYGSAQDQLVTKTAQGSSSCCGSGA